MNFDKAFEQLIGNEGGYVNDPRDPGGETKYGISKRSYPGENIAGLTLERAKAIYLRDYWGPAGCDAWPDLVKFEVFDIAVNMGVKTAVMMLQRAVGAGVDGVIGPQTTMRVQSAAGDWVVRRMVAQRIRYYTDLKTWPTYGRGWMLRLATNLESP